MSGDPGLYRGFLFLGVYVSFCYEDNICVRQCVKSIKPKLKIMLTRFFFSALFFLCLNIYATKDSTRWNYRLKGIDFKIGRSRIDIQPMQAVHLLESVTPEEQRSLYNYDNAQVIWHGLSWEPVNIHVSAVMSNDHISYTHFFKGKEFRFGLGFSIQQQGATDLRYRNIRYGPYPRTSDARLTCAYQCQYLEMGYQLTSKPFLKRLALFAGLNGAFGMNTYKQIEKYYTDFYDTHTKVDNNFNTSFFATYANVGLKYNASCDLNFFIQIEKGWNAYGKGVGGVSAFNGMAIGMRYKLLDEQDKPNYDLMKYW